MGDFRFEALMKEDMMREEVDIMSASQEEYFSYDANINGLKDLLEEKENQITKHNFGVERGTYTQSTISLSDRKLQKLNISLATTS